MNRVVWERGAWPFLRRWGAYPKWWYRKTQYARSAAGASIYARLNTKAIDRALQTQADRLCSLVQGPVVLPALTQSVTFTTMEGGRSQA